MFFADGVFYLQLFHAFVLKNIHISICQVGGLVLEYIHKNSRIFPYLEEI